MITIFEEDNPGRNVGFQNENCARAEGEEIVRILPYMYLLVQMQWAPSTWRSRDLRSAQCAQAHYHPTNDSFPNDRTSSRPTCRTKVHFSVLPVGRNKSQPISVVGCPTGWTLCSSMVHSIAMQRNMVAGSGSI